MLGVVVLHSGWDNAIAYGEVLAGHVGYLVVLYGAWKFVNSPHAWQFRRSR